LSNLRNNKAFTLIEVLVAVALFVVVIAMAGTVFRVGIESHRMAQANAEIMQTFRSITDQLNADFRGLCKEGEIYIAWKTDPSIKARGGKSNPDYGRHLGLDRIVFFTKGDFQSYERDRNSRQVIRGNVARVSYMLGSKPDDNGVIQRALALSQPERVLQRTQHILTQNKDLAAFAPLLDADETDSNEADWYAWHNYQEYDKITLQQWLDMNEISKFNALSMATAIRVQTPDLTNQGLWGSQYHDNLPAKHAHTVFGEGVGTFKIQGWYDFAGTGGRWVPDEDPNQDGDYTDSDFLLDTAHDGVFWLLYPGPRTYASVNLGGEFQALDFTGMLSEERFNDIPGLGRAMKFTFTVYDSRGLIPKGRTFTHIVYLDR